MRKYSIINKFKLLIKSIKYKIIKNRKHQKDINENSFQNNLKPSTITTSRIKTQSSSYILTSVNLKQLKPKNTQNGSESEYEEMSSDFCTLPRKKMKYRVKQKSFDKSLDAIILEAKREIIGETSSDEDEEDYVACNEENIYEEIIFNNSKIKEIDEELYEECIIIPS